MTPEKQRIAIAEACGWHHVQSCKLDSPEIYPDGAWKHPKRGRWLFRMDSKIEGGIPNYPADLNAMHEAEKTLDYEQGEQFASDIWEIIINAEDDQEYPPSSNFSYLHATAAQRAEAFLRTIEKWEEQP